MSQTTLNTSANLPSEYYNTLLLKVFDETLQLVPLGRKFPLPLNEGKLAKWLIYTKLAANTAPLQEGVVPSGGSISTANITVTIAQYGDFIFLTDLLTMTAVDDVAKNVLMRLNKQGALSLDTLVRNEIDGNADVQYANYKGSLAATGSNDVFTSKELLRASTKLMSNSVMGHSGNDYVVVIHPACRGDLMNDTNVGSWVDLNKYFDPSAKRPFNGEVGKCFDTRVLISQNISSTTSGTLNGDRVYSNLFFGEEAFGVVALDGKNLTSIVKERGSGGSSDPLNQIASCGWKAEGFAVKYFGNQGNGPHRAIRIRAGSKFAP